VSEFCDAEVDDDGGGGEMGETHPVPPCLVALENNTSPVLHPMQLTRLDAAATAGRHMA